MTKAWMIDELAHAGPEHLEVAFVAGFDRKQGYPDPRRRRCPLPRGGGTLTYPRRSGLPVASLTSAR
jgi:hypothetical protein